jgi:hypothetical protein
VHRLNRLRIVPTHAPPDRQAGANARVLAVSNEIEGTAIDSRHKLKGMSMPTEAAQAAAARFYRVSETLTPPPGAQTGAVEGAGRGEGSGKARVKTMPTRKQPSRLPQEKKVDKRKQSTPQKCT